MRLTPFFAIALVPLFLAACGPGNKQGTGTILGAVAGGAGGAAIGGKDHRIPGLAVGGVAGPFVAGAVAVLIGTAVIAVRSSRTRIPANA